MAWNVDECDVVVGDCSSDGVVESFRDNGSGSLVGDDEFLFFKLRPATLEDGGTTGGWSGIGRMGLVVVCATFVWHCCMSCNDFMFNPDDISLLCIGELSPVTGSAAGKVETGNPPRILQPKLECGCGGINNGTTDGEVSPRSSSIKEFNCTYWKYTVNNREF